MSGIAGWKTNVRAELDRLGQVFEARFGYPLEDGANFVSDADQVAQAGGSKPLLPPALALFYDEVGEVSLPDIHNGYFIHPASRFPSSVDWGLPVRVEADSIGSVATFGSDGGGGFFSLVSADCSAYYLPPGQVVDGIYSGGLGEPRKIAHDLSEFLDRLLVVIRDFVARGRTPGL
ncbi:hypothetical protein [Micromonospora chokoriensis]|uniref:SMI1 / KNR4 family (SUKH-1) n=1 Tax=Micromonospora chokoriensis TaxID=356851 RepID=A0A1C4ZAQ9_9ACTN|nr:hypothetical protein [Micromonospora chokoriensis]SCF30092.1 hypothetical protein GA0070612_6101 [Micromonospora chokoriensis]